MTILDINPFDINDNIVQQSPPLALMATPTLMSTPIIDGNTKTWKCSCSLCDHHSSSMFISPHQCDYLSPFDINGKGYISLGLLPLTELSLRLLPLDALSCGMLFMHLMNLSSWNHTSVTNQGKNNNSPVGISPPVFSATC
jgi:hypothetical protein